MVAFVLLLTLAQGPATKDAAPSISDARELRRTRAGLSAMGGGLLLTTEGVPGFGLMGEVGLVFVDRLSASARFSLLTNVGAWDFGITVGGDYAISAQLGVGIGSAVRILTGLNSPVVVIVMAPIRFSYAPFARKEKDVERSGLLLGLELGGGTAVVSTQARTGPGFPVPSLVFSGLLSIGYAWWQRVPVLTLTAVLVVASSQFEAVTSLREVRRTRAAIMAAGGGMLLGPSVVPGFGMISEAGLVFADRLSASARFSVSYSAAFELGLTIGADYALSEHLAVGLGVGGKMLAASFVATTIMTPARLTWTPWGRKPTEVERAGVVLGFELALGTVVSSTAARGTQLEVPMLVFTGHVTIGYAVW